MAHYTPDKWTREEWRAAAGCLVLWLLALAVCLLFWSAVLVLGFRAVW